MEPQTPLSFEEARERLRSRGYLDRGVEGAVLKGALAARSRMRAVLRAAALASLFLAAAYAAAEAVAVGVRSGLSLRDGLVLFCWLLLGGILAASAAVALLALAAWLRTRQRSDAANVSTELAAVFGLLAGAGAVLAARPVLAESGALAAAGVVLAAAAAVFLAVRVARGVALTVLVASGRSVLSRRPSASLALGLSLAVLAAALLLARRDGVPAPEPLVVTANARRVVVVAVDGWAESLRSPGAPKDATLFRYRKDSTDPAAFWTTVATGEPVRRHGVGSLDLVRVSGISAPVRPGPASAWFLGRLLPTLSLARFESVTSAARRVPAGWEVARRAGIPTLVVNWWTTYPADGSADVVLSNHLFFAARAGKSLAGEAWPPEAAARVAPLASRDAPPPGTAERLVADARGLDAFALAAFSREAASLRPRLSYLYLPGPDILATALGEPGRSAAERVAFATALVEEIRSIEVFLREGLGPAGPDLLAVFLDEGRGGRGGTLRLSGPLAALPSAGPVPEVRPVDVVPTLLSALGVPSSREAEGRPDPRLVAPGVTDARSVASWGRRESGTRPSIDAREYVDNLKSLGYLR